MSVELAGWTQGATLDETSEWVTAGLERVASGASGLVERRSRHTEDDQASSSAVAVQPSAVRPVLLASNRRFGSTASRLSDHPSSSAHCIGQVEQ